MEGAGEGKAGGPVEPACHDIAVQEPVRLPEEPFDRFAEPLDEPLPPVFEALWDREARWGR